MSDQRIANGKYRLQLAVGREVAAALPGAPHLVLIQGTDDGADQWEVAADSDGNYTLRNVKTGIYLGSSTENPRAPAPTLEGTSEPFAWKIEPGEEPETFTLSPRSSNGAVKLSQSIVRIYPPPLGLMPPERSLQQTWRLVRV